MKKLDAFIQALSAIIFIAFVVALLNMGLLYFKCSSAFRKVEYFPSADYVHVLVYGSSENSVSATLTLYDTDGTEVSRMERSWNASHISIDYVIVGLSGKTAAFPFSVYGEKKAPLRNNRNLYRYVVQEGKCLLAGPSLGEEASKNWADVAKFAFSPASQIFASSVDYTTINLAGCEPGKEYSIITDRFGNLTLVPVE